MTNQHIFAGFSAAIFCVLLLVGGMAGCPVYSVWEQGKRGEAALKKAEQTKQIMIETARAEKEAATLRAEAIQIMGQAAKEYPEYRLQEFMGAFGEALQSCEIDKIVMVPTEANIPLVKAVEQ